MNRSASSGVSELGLFLIPLKVCSILLNLILNGTVILIILVLIKNKTYSVMLLLSITIASLLNGLVSQTFMTLLTTFKSWHWPSQLCFFWLLIDSISNSVCLLSLLLLASHRLLIMTKPYVNRERIAKFTLVRLLALWIVPNFVWTLIFFLYSPSVQSGSGKCFLNLGFTVTLVVDITLFAAPTLLIILLNLMIVLSLRKRTSFRLKHMVARCSVAASGPSSDPPTAVELPTLEQACLFKEKRATTCLLIKTLSIVLCWPMFMFVWPIKICCPSSIDSGVYEFSNWLVYLSSTLNPIIILKFDHRIWAHCKSLMNNLQK
nr:G protein-coupled receptor [Proales similis]